MRALTLILLLVACKGGDKATPGDTALDDTAADSSAPDSPVPAVDACEATVAGPAGTDDPVLEFSRMHASVRLFRPSTDWQGADEALSAALEGETWDPATALGIYAPEVGGCALDASDRTLPAASVTLDGTTAIVKPGTGSLEIPPEATALVLDLRGLPQGAETEAALSAALEAVLSGEADLGKEKMRSFNGFPGAVTDGGTYSSSSKSATWAVSGTLPAPLPLIVWTEKALPPEAARVAGALREAGLAWLVGHPVWAQTAESSWSAVGDGGLAWPSRTMLVGSDPWPDTVPADLLTDQPEAHLDEALAWGDPTEVSAPEATRTEIERFVAETDSPLQDLDRGSSRAMLMVAHGIIDRFFPYFDVVEDIHDAAFLSSLAEVDACEEGDRTCALHALGHFMHAQQDGHGFFGDWAGTDYADNYLALQIERIDGWPVVRSSGYDEVSPGDTITEIDGVPADTLYEGSMAWHSAATVGYLFEVSGRDWLNPADTLDVRVRSVDGTERDVTLGGFPYAEMSTMVPWGGTLRPSGWLDDLGGDNLYLLNLNGAVTTTDAQWEDALTEAAGASGLVVDMRDYPAFNHYGLAEALRSGSFQSPFFETRTFTGPDNADWDETQYSFTGTGAYTGPIVLLVSNKTVSAAENFSMMLWGADNVTVIGEQSAGTNGNITATYLPGGYYFYFTGMHVLNPDGSEHHGLGIPLDVTVTPTAEDFAAGVDPELQAAITALSE